MSSIAAVSTTEGQGRLWERLALQDMNMRIENLKQYLSQLKGFDPNLFDQVTKKFDNDLRSMFEKIEQAIDIKIEEWKENMNNINKDNTKLKIDNDALKVKESKLENENKTLMKINQSLKQEIKNIDQEIRNAISEQQQRSDRQIENLFKENQTLKLKYEKEHTLAENLMQEKSNQKNQNERMQALLDQIQKENSERIKLLNDQLMEVQQDRADKELETKNLQTEMNATKTKLEEMNAMYKDQIMRLAQQKSDLSSNMTGDFQEQLKQIQKEYYADLEVREQVWNKAKEESLQTLTEAYNKLKDGLGKQNKELHDMIEKYINEINDLRITIEKFKSDKKNLESEIHKKEEKLKKLQQEEQNNLNKFSQLNDHIMELEREMTQYKIVWNHFFGLDVPLREQILIAKEKLNQFEQQHNISPVPLKKSRIEIECLERFGQIPLRLGETPLSSNGLERFELINSFNDKEILLKSFSLCNESGDRIQIPERYLKPGHSIGFSIGNKKIKEDDLLVPEKFCMFDDKSRLILEDGCFPNHNEILFPVSIEIIRCLDRLNNKMPIVISSIKTDIRKDGWRGFELKNRSKKCILLQNMSIARQNYNFSQIIPEKTLNPNDALRFVLTNDTNNNQYMNPDYVLIDETAFGTLENPDKLLMIDNHNHFQVLYDGTNLQNLSSNCCML